MRVGFVGDVHGDLDGLKWSLHVLSEVDLIVCLGDVVGGKQESDCIALLQENNVLVLQGNHDHWETLNPRTRLPQDSLQWLSSLRRTYSQGEWMAYHALFDHDPVTGSCTWHEMESSAAAQNVWQKCEARIVFCAHSHIPSLNLLGPAGIEFVPQSRLRLSPHLPLRARTRYIANAGQCSDCALLYSDTSAHEYLEFVFRRT